MPLQTFCTQHHCVVPERTAGAAGAAWSAEKPEAECGRPTGTGE